jgi:uncharacterized protein YjbI with pentapeptide repeats
MLMLMALIAALLGWRSAVNRGELQLAQQAGRLQYAEEELARARDALNDRRRIMPDKTRVLWQARLAGANLSELTLASTSNAFQRASFADCNLEKAVLKGGSSSFQLACFDNANLAGAKLTGGGASFQGATFVGANLQGAVLSGAGGSFQQASFENATLVGARLAGSFQLANISGADFAGADLSALGAEDLASCYFKEPPTYDERTKFPAGFDPRARLWRKTSK